VEDTDAYCGRCGAPQPNAPRPPHTDPFAGMSPRTASILCYIPVVGWVAAIVVLAADKFRSDRRVRFHAFQGIYLFVLWLIVKEVISPMFRPIGHHFPDLLQAAMVFLWIFMLIKTSQDETYSLPVIGELAEKSVAER
jgi:uncharacterized membrane protein